MAGINIRTEKVTCNVRADGLITLDSRKRRCSLVDKDNIAEIKFINGGVTVALGADQQSYNVTTSVTGNVPFDSTTINGSEHWLTGIKVDNAVHNIYSNGTIVTADGASCDALKDQLGIAISIPTGAVTITESRESLVVGSSTTSVFAKPDIDNTPSASKRPKGKTTPVLDEPTVRNEGVTDTLLTTTTRCVVL